MALTIVETSSVTGGVDTQRRRACRRRAQPYRRLGRHQEFPDHSGRLRPCVGLAAFVRSGRTRRSGGHRQLRRRPDPTFDRGGGEGGRGGPLRPPGPLPLRQVRPARRRERSACRTVGQSQRCAFWLGRRLCQAPSVSRSTARTWRRGNIRFHSVSRASWSSKMRSTSYVPFRRQRS